LQVEFKRHGRALYIKSALRSLKNRQRLTI
jgi:hypothetical protein